MGDLVELGNMVQSVAGSLYQSLNELLQNMHAMTPELRNVKLRENLWIFHMNLERLMTLTKWLKFSGMKGELESISSMQHNGNMQHLAWERTLSALYYFHAEFYSKRIRSLNVSLTRELLLSSVFPYLPEAMFTTIQRVPLITKQEVSKEIDLYIKLKLGLQEKIPSSCSVVRLNDGVLILEKRNLFRVAFTLSHADLSAAWKPLHFAVLANFSNESLPRNSEHTNELEFKVMNALVRIYVLVINKEADLQSLEELWQVCYYMCTMYILRMFYVQTVMNTRHYSTVKSEAIFKNSDVDRNELILRLWDGDHRFELTMCALRSISSFRMLLSVGQLDVPKEDRTYLKDLDVYFEHSIEAGNIYKLYDKVIMTCATVLLQVLYKRLATSLSENALRAGLVIKVVDYGIILSFADVALRICVDLKTGAFNLSSTNYGVLGLHLVYAAEKFTGEINSENNGEILNVLNERDEKDNIDSSSVHQRGHSVNATITSEIMLRYMLNAFGINHLQKVFSAEANNDYGIRVAGENEDDEWIFHLDKGDIQQDGKNYEFYLSIGSKAGEFWPIFRVVCCDSSEVSNCKMLTPDVDSNTSIGDLDYVYADILSQCYNFMVDYDAP